MNLSHIGKLFRTLSEAIFLLVSICAIPATAAEDEITLLIIEGDLIGPLETLDAIEGPAVIIDNYHQQVPAEIGSILQSLQQELTNLIPDYDVAYRATDSAEISEVEDKMNLVWTKIREIHSQYFTLEVIEILNGAFSEAYPPLAH